ncbi:MAG TPA: ParB/RepB/Spo0J family partition protein [Candidatus Udaeobacter sp.]|jgi:ParB-like chromosome segregation protein Spo0J
MNGEQVITIDPYEVKFLIHREREPKKFALLKESIREIGVRQPLHVRDISRWPAKDRRRPDGGLYKWEAHFGEGRTTATLELHEETKDRRFLKLPAIVKDVPEGEIVGRFLSENILRRDHTWFDQAKLIRADVNRGLSFKEIARLYFITEPHAKKLIHILEVASGRLQKQLPEMTLKDATAITSLPARGQEIVLDILREADVDKSQLEHVVRKARALEDRGELSKSALEASLKRVDEDLARLRPKLKLMRLHHALGPQNLELLLEDKLFRSELDRHGINYSKFAAEVKR